MRPNIIASIMGIDEISEEGLSVMEDGSIQVKSLEEDLVKYTTIIKGRVSEISYCHEGRLVVSAEFKSFQNVDGVWLPKSVSIKWNEEGVKTTADIVNFAINIGNPPEIKMPEGLKKVSLVGY
jgi:hypothetical protein